MTPRAFLRISHVYTYGDDPCSTFQVIAEGVYINSDGVVLSANPVLTGIDPTLLVSEYDLDQALRVGLADYMTNSQSQTIDPNQIFFVNGR